MHIHQYREKVLTVDVTAPPQAEVGVSVVGGGQVGVVHFLVAVDPVVRSHRDAERGEGGACAQAGGQHQQLLLAAHSRVLIEAGRVRVMGR